MCLELDPAQPPEVVAAVEALLRPDGDGPDPWWQAGIHEALGLEDEPQGDATAPPRSSRGAARA